MFFVPEAFNANKVFGTSETESLSHLFYPLLDMGHTEELLALNVLPPGNLTLEQLPHTWHGTSVLQRASLGLGSPC